MLKRDLSTAREADLTLYSKKVRRDDIQAELDLVEAVPFEDANAEGLVIQLDTEAFQGLQRQCADTEFSAIQTMPGAYWAVGKLKAMTIWKQEIQLDRVEDAPNYIFWMAGGRDAGWYVGRSVYQKKGAIAWLGNDEFPDCISCPAFALDRMPLHGAQVLT